MKEQKVALTLGYFFSGAHLVWSLLILIGWAQPLLDFIFWAHMVANPWQVTGFSLVQSLTLIIVTFIVGYIVGFILAKVWNATHR